MVRSPGNRGDMLRVKVEYRSPGKRAPVSVPVVSSAAPGRGPDVTVVSYNEQVKIARSPRNRGYLLRVTVKHRLPGKRPPVRVPASGTAPGRGPDVTIGGSDAAVVSDDEQVKIARSS